MITVLTVALGRHCFVRAVVKLVIVCVKVLMFNGNCTCSTSVGVLTRMSEDVFNVSRLCREDPMSPRKLLDAVPTVTRAVVKFLYYGCVSVTKRAMRSGVGILGITNLIVMTLKFKLSLVNFKVGGHV